MRILSHVLLVLALLVLVGGFIEVRSYRAESAIQETALSLKLTNTLLGTLVLVMLSIAARMSHLRSQRDRHHEELMVHLESLRRLAKQGEAAP